MKLNDFINKYGDITVDENELKEFLGMNKYFMPAKGEGYWYTNHKGEVSYFENNLDDFDELLFKHCEVFKTKGEAEEHVKKKRFLLKMKRDFLDNSDEIDWNDTDQMKYCLTYDHSLFTSVIDYHETIQPGTTYVTTNRAWLGLYIRDYEEEIEKYYFEVEEKENSND